jgi:hypothetical protein
LGGEDGDGLKGEIEPGGAEVMTTCTEPARKAAVIASAAAVLQNDQ